MKKKDKKEQKLKKKNKNHNGLVMKIRKIINYFKRLSEEEKRKKEEKKNNPNVSIKPKGFFARKIGVISFWSLFAFMFLVVIITLLGGDKSSADVDFKKILEESHNNATTSEAVQFAENFTRDYFNWKTTDEGKHNRKETMAAYLADGLNEYAGIDLNKLEWNSKFKKAELKKVEAKGENIAHITFKVQFELSQGKEKTNKNSKYFVVPVAYDGYSFGVYELPKFTYIEEETTVSEVTRPKLKQAKTGVKSDVNDFLETFFASYSQDGQDKLNYLLEKDNTISGLDGSLLFSEINSLDVFMPEEESDNYKEEYIVFTDLTFIDPDTELPFRTNYQLRIVMKEDRYMVAGIDDLEEMTVKSNIDAEESIFDQEIDVEGITDNKSNNGKLETESKKGDGDNK